MSYVPRLHAVPFLGVLLVMQAFVSLHALADGVAIDPAVRQQFEWLSKNGNSTCSLAYFNSVESMAASARLQGSCCSEMDLEHYASQLDALKRYAAISEIPPDPYDIPAPLAQQAMAAYDMQLAADEQAAYDYAMANSHEKGPCCCKCWRWHTYGGLAKLLIRNHGFNGEQITEVWNLSDGCGGGDHDPS